MAGLPGFAMGERMNISDLLSDTKHLKPKSVTTTAPAPERHTKSWRELLADMPWKDLEEQGVNWVIVILSLMAATWLLHYLWKRRRYVAKFCGFPELSSRKGDQTNCLMLRLQQGPAVISIHLMDLIFSVDGTALNRYPTPGLMGITFHQDCPWSKPYVQMSWSKHLELMVDGHLTEIELPRLARVKRHHANMAREALEDDTAVVTLSYKPADGPAIPIPWPTDVDHVARPGM